MLFKNVVPGLLALSSLLLSGCSLEMSGGDQMDFGFGKPLSAFGALDEAQGVSSNRVAVYDSGSNRIHQFELGTMSLEKSYAASPGTEHYVIYDQDDDYIVDVAGKQISIFTSDGTVINNPLKFIGTPKGGAYSKDQRILVLYDDLMSMGFLKLSATGKVESSWIGGSLVKGKTVSAGDIDQSGKLILGMDDNSILVVDALQVVNAQDWPDNASIPSFPSGLTKIVWLAPVKGANHILVSSEKELKLIDLDTQATLDTVDLSEMVVLRYSKEVDCHLVAAEKYNHKGEVTLFYVNGANIESRKIKQDREIAQSRLDLSANKWTLTEQWVTSISFFESKISLRIKQWDFLKHKALLEWELPKEAKTQITGRYVFALFPSQTGYAQSYDLDTGTTTPVREFNLPFVH